MKLFGWTWGGRLLLIVLWTALQAGATLWYVNRVKWDYWSYGYARDRCDRLAEPAYCEGIDEWGRPTK
jgi:hypothetical protein